MSHQDWEVRAVGGKGTRKISNQNKPAATVEEKKQQKVRVDEEQEDFTQAKVPRKFSVALQKARVNKGWKQADLAQVNNMYIYIVSYNQNNNTLIIFIHYNRIA